jgi:hypothetical protein
MIWDHYSGAWLKRKFLWLVVIITVMNHLLHI